MKKIIYFFVIFGLIFSLAPFSTWAQEEPSITEQEILHFVIFVRWGNVLEEPTYREKTDYNGSISLTGQSGRVSLVREMQFEKHNEDCDKILTKFPTVSWQSCIYNHWDGVKVLVSGQASDILTIQTTQGNLTKTVKEFYQTRTPIIQNLNNNQEIVVKIFPLKKGDYFLTIFWGEGEKNQKIDFSGSLKLENSATIKLVKSLRFEKEQGDKINSQTSTEVVWNSFIEGDCDGLLSKIIFAKEGAQNASLTINFSNSQVNWQKTFNLVDVYHQRLIKETIPVSGITKPSQLILAVKRHPNGKLVKVRNQTKIYLLEDDVKRPIPSLEILKENKLKLKDLEVVSEEELETYPEGERLTYPDGTLLKSTGPTVYLISEGKKRAFKNLGALRRLGYQIKNVKKVQEQDLAQIENGPSITEKSELPEGSLIREEGKKEIYLIEGGQKKLMTTEMFRARGFDLNRVGTVRKNLLDKFTINEAPSYPDGTLLKGSGQGIYLIDKGKRRPIRNLEDFKSLKLKLESVKKIKDSELKKIPEAEEIIGE